MKNSFNLSLIAILAILVIASISTNVYSVGTKECYHDTGYIGIIQSNQSCSAYHSSMNPNIPSHVGGNADDCTVYSKQTGSINF